MIFTPINLLHIKNYSSAFLQICKYITVFIIQPISNSKYDIASQIVHILGFFFWNFFCRWAALYFKFIDVCILTG